MRTRPPRWGLFRLNFYFVIESFYGNNMKADIFFFVTTICVVLVSVFLIILLARLSMLMKSVRDLVEKVKDKALDVGDGMEEILERVEDSFLFNLIFPVKFLLELCVNQLFWRLIFNLFHWI